MANTKHEDAIMKSGLSVRDYFDRPVLAAEIVKNTSALNINQTPQDLANNLLEEYNLSSKT